MTQDEYVSEAEPIVVGGCGRSGTTLLRVMLDSHPDLVAGPESNLLLVDGAKRVDVDELSRRFRMDPTDIERLTSASRTHAEFVDKFFGELRQVHHAVRWVEKSPRNIHNLNWIFSHFPRARFVHVLRDGRDVVCSLRTHPRFRVGPDGSLVPTGIEHPLVECIARWREDVQAGLPWREDWRYREVRYEDLVAYPEATLRALLTWLGLDWHPAVLRFDEVDGPTRDVTTFPQNPEATQALTNQAVGRWRTDLTSEQAAQIERELADLLAEFGYL